MREWFFAWALAAGSTFACSASIAPDERHPGLVVTPIPVGEGGQSAQIGAAATTTSTGSAQPPPRPAPHDPPDPQPLAASLHWEFRLRFHEGRVHVASVSRKVFERPVVTPRPMGRFALELWIGHELIDRVRFDFPLLGAETPPSERESIRAEPRFEPGLEAERTVLLPHSERATRAQLVDRATGTIRALPWPPDAPLDPMPDAVPTAAPPAVGPADAR